MAQNSQQSITIGVIRFVLIIQLPIVFATAVPMIKIARKLKKVAQSTAYLGDSTRVDTNVAIEFALSCIPLVKSKTRATNTIKVTKGF